MNYSRPSVVRRAEDELALLLAACIDYQRVLVRASVPDPVAGRIEALFAKYQIEPTKRSQYGEHP